MPNQDNIISGHKANLSNPNTSDESKKHSEEVLKEKLAVGEPHTAHDNTGHVAAGLKATIHNDNMSSTAKAAAQEKLDVMEQSGELDKLEGAKDPGYVAAGLRSTLSNPKVSTEAKAKAQAKLKEMGEE